jgi:biotin carboxyl carrier protein
VAELSVTAIGNGVYRVSDGTRSRVAYAAAAGDDRWVFIDGRVYVIDVGDLGNTSESGTPKGVPHTSVAQPSRVAQPFRVARKKTRDDHSALAAPMPATVVRIIAEPGQRVSKGDVMIMLEAMKMELPIKAPRDGVVKSIACKPGELVQPGVALLELE